MSKESGNFWGKREKEFIILCGFPSQSFPLFLQKFCVSVLLLLYKHIYMLMLFFVAKLFKCVKFCGKTTNYRIVFDSEGRFPSKRCLQSGRASQTFVLYRTIVCETAAHTSQFGSLESNMGELGEGEGAFPHFQMTAHYFSTDEHKSRIL